MWNRILVFGFEIGVHDVGLCGKGGDYEVEYLAKCGGRYLRRVSRLERKVSFMLCPFVELAWAGWNILEEELQCVENRAASDCIWALRYSVNHRIQLAIDQRQRRQCFWFIFALLQCSGRLGRWDG